MVVKLLLKCAIRFSISLVRISEFFYAHFSSSYVPCTESPQKLARPLRLSLPFSSGVRVQLDVQDWHRPRVQTALPGCGGTTPTGAVQLGRQDEGHSVAWHELGASGGDQQSHKRQRVHAPGASHRLRAHRGGGPHVVRVFGPSRNAPCHFACCRYCEPRGGEWDGRDQGHVFFFW